ncbi:helix-turn-helix domain-containing protein [Actinoallomurus liliacearum]|uniref:Helix-turn-helix domain-containing protein n=1 Tax=Actinoallomurus liliacearum TaxID=1080073 RepID=A0ABP8TYM6_9ACTN
MTVARRQDTESRPWLAVPRGTAAWLRPLVGPLADEVIAEIGSRLPEFDRPEDDVFQHQQRLAVEGALRQFVDLLENPRAPWESIASVYRTIGAWEADQGRSLDALQRSLRVGARLAWRRIADQCDSPDVLGPLAEAIFLFLDEIAAAASEGYLKAIGRAAGEVERRRRRLLGLLLSDPPASPEEVAEVARIAGWALPRTVAGVALHERKQDQFTPLTLPPDVLVDTDGPQPYLLLPDPDGPGRSRILEAIDVDWITAVGPTAPLRSAANSLRWAREALALVRRGIISPDGLIRCSDHEATLVIFRDEDFIRNVAAGRLAPLDALRPAQRERLAETLLACLQRGFNANEAAERLHIHPQTVRYRLRQLEDLFGERLYDTDRQLALEMALHAWLALTRADEA